MHYYVVFLLAAFCRVLYTLYWKEKRVVISWPIYVRRIFPPGMFMKSSLFNGSGAYYAENNKHLEMIVIISVCLVMLLDHMTYCC